MITITNPNGTHTIQAQSVSYTGMGKVNLSIKGDDVAAMAAKLDYATQVVAEGFDSRTTYQASANYPARLTNLYYTPERHSMTVVLTGLEAVEETA